MRKSGFTENQKLMILKEVENGRKVAEVCRENNISTTGYFKWKSKFGGMEASDIRRLKELEAENSRLKRMYADLSLENEALKDVIEKKAVTPASRRKDGQPDRDLPGMQRPAGARFRM